VAAPTTLEWNTAGSPSPEHDITDVGSFGSEDAHAKRKRRRR
jgi:hypothetical protein